MEILPPPPSPPLPQGLGSGVLVAARAEDAAEEEPQERQLRPHTPLDDQELKQTESWMGSN